MALQKGRADLTGALVLAALFLFTLDVAARRLRWDARLPGWLAALRQRMRRRGGAARSMPAPAAGFATPDPAKEPTQTKRAEDPSSANGAELSAPEPAKESTQTKRAESPSNAMRELLERRKKQKRQ